MSVRPALLLATLLVAGCAGGPPTASATLGDLEISGGFAYRPITPASGAAYFRVRNTGPTADTLIEASSPVTRGAMFHGGGMAHLDRIPIPAGGELVLAPGGTHLMLSDYDPAPEAGDSLPVVLRFAHGGSVTLRLPVRRYSE